MKVIYVMRKIFRNFAQIDKTVNYGNTCKISVGD